MTLPPPPPPPNGWRLHGQHERFHPASGKRQIQRRGSVPDLAGKRFLREVSRTCWKEGREVKRGRGMVIKRRNASAGELVLKRKGERLRSKENRERALSSLHRARSLDSAGWVASEDRERGGAPDRRHSGWVGDREKGLWIVCEAGSWRTRARGAHHTVTPFFYFFRVFVCVCGWRRVRQVKLCKCLYIANNYSRLYCFLLVHCMIVACKYV